MCSSDLEGIIDLDPGSVAVYQVPPVRSGGSRAVDADALAEACDDAGVLAATGVEAVVALRTAGVDPDTTFAAGEVAAAAAARGLDVVVVATADSVGRVTDALRNEGVAYEVADAR